MQIFSLPKGEVPERNGHKTGVKKTDREKRLWEQNELNQAADLLRLGEVLTMTQPWCVAEKTLERTTKSLAGSNLKPIFPDLAHPE